MIVINRLNSRKMVVLMDNVLTSKSLFLRLYTLLHFFLIMLSKFVQVKDCRSVSEQYQW